MFDILTQLWEMMAKFLKGFITTSASNATANTQNVLSNSAGFIQNGITELNLEAVVDILHKAILPVAGLILTAVMCLELIRMIVNRNTMTDVSTEDFFKWLIKCTILILVVLNSKNIVFGILEIGTYVVNKFLNGGLMGQLDTLIDTSNLPDDVWELAWLALITSIVAFSLKIATYMVFAVLTGRILEIVVVASVAPIPLATLGAEEWKNVGYNYIRSLFAYALQGVIIVVIISVFNQLGSSLISSYSSTLAGDFTSKLILLLIMVLSLVLGLFKSGAIAKSIVAAG